MSDLFLLSKAQMRRIEPYFPLSHGIRVSMTGRLSVALSLSSGTVCAGAMHQRITVRTRRFTTVSSGGAVWGCSIVSSRPWRTR